MTFPSPVSGAVTSVNSELLDHADWINVKPYEIGWICSVEAANLTADLKDLRIGAGTVSWYQDEFDRFREMFEKISDQMTDEPSKEGNGELAQSKKMDDAAWQAFAKSFLHG